MRTRCLRMSEAGDRLLRLCVATELHVRGVWRLGVSQLRRRLVSAPVRGFWRALCRRQPPVLNAPSQQEGLSSRAVRASTRILELESRCSGYPHRGFESHPLRQFLPRFLPDSTMEVISASLVGCERLSAWRCWLSSRSWGCPSSKKWRCNSVGLTRMKIR